MRDRLIELLDGADLFLRNRANAKPTSLNQYDIENLKDIAKVCDEAARTLEKAIIPPCKVGDVVYVISECANVFMSHDNDYYTGTGAIECPFENECEFDECSDDNVRIFKTMVTGFMYEDYENPLSFHTFLEDIRVGDDCWGKTVFLTKEEAEQALQQRKEDDGK